MKSIWQSKVFWFNLVSILLEVAQMITQYNVLPPGTVLIIVNVLNILLRFITKDVVMLTGEPTNTKELT